MTYLPGPFHSGLVLESATICTRKRQIEGNACRKADMMCNYYISCYKHNIQAIHRTLIHVASIKAGRPQ